MLLKAPEELDWLTFQDLEKAAKKTNYYDEFRQFRLFK